MHIVENDIWDVFDLQILRYFNIKDFWGNYAYSNVSKTIGF